MSSFVQQSLREQARFNAMAGELGRVAKSRHLLMDDQFQVVDKRGWRWIVLSLFRPFYRLFCQDPYSHYRAEKVAAAILRACASNQVLLKINPTLQATVLGGISALDKKTKGKFKEVHAKISKLVADKPPQPRLQAETVRIAQLPVPRAEDLEPQQKAKSGHVRHTSTSRIRRSAAAADQPPARDFQLVWPREADLEACGVSQEQTIALQVNLERLVGKCLDGSGRRLSFVKEEGRRMLQLVNQWNQVEEQVETPLSLEVVYEDNQLRDILLLTKLIIARGGETKVRLCFSLSQGIQLVRKNCFGRLQRQLLEYFIEARPRGIIPIRAIRESAVEMGLKVQSLEHFWLGNLREFITNQPIPSLKDRLKIAIDILHGAQAIHGIVCEEYTLGDGTSIEEPFKMFHLDLGPSNVLLNQKEDGTLEDAVLTDFGCAHPENVGGTPGFKAPEQITLCRQYEKMDRSEIIGHNIRYGQASDCWSLGLLLITLFTWTVDPLGGPPLPCIVDSLNKARGPADSVAVDSNISFLRQREIDDDITKLKKECIAKEQGAQKILAMTRVWDEVIGRMVQTDPSSRIPVQTALEVLERLVIR